MFQHEARPFEISAMKPNAKNMLRSHANIRDPRADWFYKSHFLRNPNVSCQRLVERKYEIFHETFKLKGVRNKFWKAETEYFYVLCWCVMVIKSYLFSLSLHVCSLHMGQFLQGGRNGRLMSFFFLKVEPSCDQTWWDSPVFFSIVSCLSYVLSAKNTLVRPVGSF